MGNEERIRNSKTNIMTTRTKRFLEDALKQAREELRQSQLAIGEAAGSESNWHDNAAFDYANMDFDLKSAQLASLEKKLQNVELIIPRQETDKVGIGNSVVIQFLDKTDQETFTILGPDDSGKKPGWLSYLSPLAKSIIGKKEGETVIFSTEDKQNYSIVITKILPGEFE